MSFKKLRFKKCTILFEQLKINWPNGKDLFLHGVLYLDVVVYLLPN
jgi:hypothetical protein